eukprot:UN10899
MVFQFFDSSQKEKSDFSARGLLPYLEEFEVLR